MPLPNPAMSFSPFAILTAEEMNNLVENIEALQDGSALDSNTIDAAFLLNATILNTKFSTTAGQLGGALTTWSPILTNFTLGNGTMVARYQQVGKIVRGYVLFTLGSTSAVGSGGTMSLPVTASSNYALGLGNSVGHLLCMDGVATSGIGYCRLESSTTMRPILYNASGTYVTASGVSSTVPFTWATGDVLFMSFEYEAA
jgi:hypothetical protein